MLDYNVVCNYKTSEYICSDLIIALNHAITNKNNASTYIIRQDNFIFGVLVTFGGVLAFSLV